MNCPKCGVDNSQVVDSRGSEGTHLAETARRRRHRCLNCGARFTTYEILDTELKQLTARSSRGLVITSISDESLQLLDRLAAFGIYGSTRAEVAGRFVDEALQKFCAQPVLALAAPAFENTIPDEETHDDEPTVNG